MQVSVLVRGQARPPGWPWQAGPDQQALAAELLGGLGFSWPQGQWAPSPTHHQQQGLGAAGWPHADLRGLLWVKAGPPSFPFPSARQLAWGGKLPSSLVFTQNCSWGSISPKLSSEGSLTLCSHFSEFLAGPCSPPSKTALRHPGIFLFGYRHADALQFLAPGERTPHIHDMTKAVSEDVKKDQITPPWAYFRGCLPQRGVTSTEVGHTPCSHAGLWVPCSSFHLQVMMGQGPSPKERQPPFPMSAIYRSRQPQKTSLIFWDPNVSSSFSFLLQYKPQKVTIHTNIRHHRTQIASRVYLLQPSLLPMASFISTPSPRSCNKAAPSLANYFWSCQKRTRKAYHNRFLLGIRHTVWFTWVLFSPRYCTLCETSSR